MMDPRDNAGVSAAPPVPKPPATNRLRKIFSWALALAAISLVAWVVPIRDRCEDPGSHSNSTRVVITRDHDECILHIPSGDVTISRAQCAALKCEPGLASTFARANIWILAALWGVYLAGTLAWAIRWRMLLAFADVKLSVWSIWRISIEAQAGGILLPGGLGGDALRIAFVVQRGAPLPIAIASAVLDRIIGLVTLAAVAAALGLTFAGAQIGALGWGLASLPFFFLAGVAALRSRFLADLSWLNAGRVGRIAQPVLTYFADPRAPWAVLRGVGVSLFVSAVQLGVVRGLIAVLGATPANETRVYVGSAMSMIAAAIPALPGGWGTGDAAYVFFLGLAGLAPGVALAVCLLFRLFWYLLGVVGAVLYMLSTAGTGARSRAK